MAVRIPDSTPTNTPGGWHRPNGLTGGLNVGTKPNGNGGGNGGNPTQGLLSAFLPGQLGSLAQQLQQGFGGGVPKWKGILAQPYADMTINPNPLGYPPTPDNKGGKGDDGKGHGKGGDGDGGGGGNNVDYGDHDQLHGFNEHSGAPYLRPGMMAQATNPMAMQAFQPGANPTIQGPIQQQMFGQPAQMNPQLLAMLRQRLMGG